jgi:hypothetical protein
MNIIEKIGLLLFILGLFLLTQSVIEPSYPCGISAFGVVLFLAGDL